MNVIDSISGTVAKVVDEYNKYKITEKSAALAYHAIFALSPILILLTSFASLFMFGSIAQGEIQEFFGDFFGPGANTFIERIVEDASNQSVNITVTAVGFIIVLYAATNFFRAVQSSLFEVFSVSIDEKSKTKNILYTYLYSLGYLLAFLFFIVVLFAARLFLSSSFNFVEELFSYTISPHAIKAITALVVLALLSLFLSVTYRFFSKRKVSWKDSFIGATSAAITILLTSYALSFFFTFSNILVLYGAASFLVAMLLWIYVFALLFFSGALIARYFSNE